MDRSPLSLASGLSISRLGPEGPEKRDLGDPPQEHHPAPAAFGKPLVFAGESRRIRAPSVSAPMVTRLQQVLSVLVAVGPHFLQAHLLYQVSHSGIQRHGANVLRGPRGDRQPI